MLSLDGGMEMKMKTQEAVLTINKYFNDKHLGVCSVGRTAEEAFRNIKNNQLLFLDCMGSVTGTAIGISLGCQEIWVDALDTDGSFMYSLSILHTISAMKEKLRRLTIYIFDNEILESGGGLVSRYINFDWRGFCKSWEIDSLIIEDIIELEKFLNQRMNMKEPQVVILKVENKGVANLCKKNIDGHESKYMFKRYINDNIRRGIIKPCLKN